MYYLYPILSMILSLVSFSYTDLNFIIMSVVCVRVYASVYIAV